MSDQTNRQKRESITASLLQREKNFNTILASGLSDQAADTVVAGLSASAQTATALAVLSLADEVAELRAVIEKGQNDG